ncbi:type I-E CRISPR-associated protein Cas5/CasD [Formicincola oecophyllae]|uniref:Type I-E CRISPR-associated protein Cas5/CasD n=1 Tax=Formicincola oecophyllae TaxID=2558361 RepID=A0A4Y6U9Y4_9PROT|nr:type I-E CRISPR-associated protein Cas5/CasD [Formicincola oecophyllae]QDH13388.1 type I-E CRISPR-associated protein Cas5/CasD [Formicincola oecophyllae]
MRFLALHFQAPLASFGDVMVDNYGNTALFPALSMVTGLLANALGYDRTEKTRLDALQKSLLLGSFHWGPAPERLPDFQTLRLNEPGEHWLNQGWTSFGAPEGRDGEKKPATHIRYRHYLADVDMNVLVASQPTGHGAPTLGDFEQALLKPARPLSLGRKPCLPSAPLLAVTPQNRYVEGTSMREALLTLATRRARTMDPPPSTITLQRPANESDEALRTKSITDERNWIGGFHGGERQVVVEANVQLPPLESP